MPQVYTAANPCAIYLALQVLRPRSRSGVANFLPTTYDCVPGKVRAGLMAEYTVKFEVFEGPLDLLLYLIKKEEVDIYEVNLTLLATQFIEYIETMRLLDLEVA